VLTAAASAIPSRSIPGSEQVQWGAGSCLSSWAEPIQRPDLVVPRRATATHLGVFPFFDEQGAEVVELVFHELVLMPLRAELGDITALQSSQRGGRELTTPLDE